MEKRKHSADDDGRIDSSPPKLQAASLSRIVGPMLPSFQNPNEVALDSDMEDDHNTPEHCEKLAERFIGPALPTLADAGGHHSEPEESCYPKINTKPPSIQAKTQGQWKIRPAASTSEVSKHPAHHSNPDHCSSSDSNDDFGPSLPSLSSHAEASPIGQLKGNSYSPEPNMPCKPQRAEWMLAPPTSSDWINRIDPTKLKNRKFASGKSAHTSDKNSGVSSLWTESYEQKRQRLEDEVLGRSQADSSLQTQKPAKTRNHEREFETTEKLIREYNKKNRNKSLMEDREVAQARGQLKKEEDDDPSRRGFDREKDMALGGRMGTAKKRELLKSAASFESRFQKGEYL